MASPRLVTRKAILRFDGDAGAMLARAADLPGIALIDADGSREPSRASILAVGLRPVVSWSGAAGERDPLPALRAILRGRALERDPEWPFLGGLVGWLGYDVRTLFEALPQRHPRETSLPDTWWAEARAGAARRASDGAAVLWWLEDPLDARESERARSLAEALRARLEAPARKDEARVPEPPLAPEDIRWPSREAHLRRVAAGLDHIARGDVYQVNLAQRWECPRPRDLVGVYRRLRAVHRPAFGGFFPVGEEAILCVSPERFLEVDGDRVTTCPIKGTAGRDPDAAADAARARALLASPKDRAELAMIVDILRNDLSRVCAPGTVLVPRPIGLETHPTVHHLAATVTGRLEPPADLVDLLAATVPGGSITGAPRIRAMEIIDALECCRRGPYCGALGWIGFDGRMDLNILIRTACTAGSRLFFHGGGGVVADSDPEAEHRETVVKVSGILRALAGDHAAR